MRLFEIRNKLLRSHYYLNNPRFWYDKGLQEASKIFCTNASDINLEIGKTNPFRNRPVGGPESGQDQS